MSLEEITYQQLLKEHYPTYYLDWYQLGSIIHHKLVFHDSKKLKDYILRIEKDYKNVSYTIKKTKKQLMQ